MKKIIIAVAACSAFVASAQAGNVTALFGSQIGSNRQTAVIAVNGGASTTALATINTGWAARHIAGTTLDVKAIKIHWNAVSSPGQVRVRYETVNAATGKPTNTAYDANATLAAQSPTAGVQTYTFGTLPTTGRTVGSAYAVTVVTTTGGTTQTLNSHIVETVPSMLPASLLTTSDAGTTWTETAGATPVVVLVMEDDTEVSLQEGLSPYSSVTLQNVFSANGIASTVVLPVRVEIMGVAIPAVSKIGTPAGDLRIRIMDAASSIVSGTTYLLDKDSISTNINARGATAIFPAPVSLPAGTYRIVADCTSCVDVNNCWRLSTADSMSTLSVPSGYSSSTTSNSTATPPTWTDSATKVSSMGFILSDIPVPTGGGVIGG